MRDWWAGENMLHNCLDIASFFENGEVTSDDIAGGNFINLKVASGASVLLRQVSGSWEYVSTNADRSTLQAWCTANNLVLPSVSQLNAVITYSGNVYLTAGELAKILVHMGLYGAAEVNGVAADADATTSANAIEAMIPVSSYAVPDAQSLSAINPFRSKGIYPFNHYYPISLKPTKTPSKYYVGSGNSPNVYDFNGDFAVDGVAPQYIRYTPKTFNWNDRFSFSDANGYYFPSTAQKDYDFLRIKLSDGKSQTLCTMRDLCNARLRVIYGIGLSITPNNPAGAPGYRADHFKLRVRVVGLAGDSASSTTGWHMFNYSHTFEIDLSSTWITGIEVANVSSNDNALPGDVTYSDTSADTSFTNRFTYRFNPSAWRVNPQLFPASVGSLDAPARTFNIFAPLQYDGKYIDWDASAPLSVYNTVLASGNDIAVQLNAVDASTLTDLSFDNAYVLLADQESQAYVHLRSVDWDSEVQEYLLPSVAKYSGGDVRLTFFTDVWNVINEPMFAGVTTVRARAQATINDIGVVTEVTDTKSKSYDTNALFVNALNAIDVFQADNIVGTPINDQLRNIIASVYSTMDTYMAMYADYTANLVVAEVLDAIVASVTAGVEMDTTYGVTDTTELTVEYKDGSVRSFSAAQLRSAQDTASTRAVLQTISDTSKNLNYSLALFVEMHEAFQDTASLTEFSARVARKVAEAKESAMTIATLRPNVATEALFLNCARTESMYSRIMAVINSAIAAGQTTLSDAVNYMTKVAPEFGYYLTETDDKSLYTAVLNASVYDDYLANITQTPYTLKDSDVSYWGTYINRVGASILNNPSPDSEFQVMSDGALYVYPPLISTRISSADLGHAMNDTQYFTAPFKYSYAMLHYVADGVYQLDWCARFNGGNDVDLINAFDKSWQEFFAICGDLARAYSGNDADFAIHYPELPDGFVGKAIANDVVGALGVIATSTLGWILGNDWSGTKTIANTLGAKQAVKASLPSIAIGAAIGTVVSGAGLVWEDKKGQANSDFSAQSVVSSTNQPSFVADISISGYAALSSTGYQAVRNLASCFAWALRHGLIAPVGEYASDRNQSVGIGVYSPGIVPPKFVYTGEKTDYSALMITATIGITAAYTRRYMRYQKVRTVSYLPATTTMAAASVAGDVLSEITSEDDASESDLIDLADQLQGEQEVSLTDVNDTVRAMASLLGVTFDESGAVDQLALSTLLGTIGSIASISQVIGAKTETIETSVSGMTRRVYRY